VVGVYDGEVGEIGPEYNGEEPPGSPDAASPS
jgi:hypothetical protein